MDRSRMVASRMLFRPPPSRQRMKKGFLVLPSSSCLSGGELGLVSCCGEGIVVVGRGSCGEGSCCVVDRWGVVGCGSIGI